MSEPVLFRINNIPFRISIQKEGKKIKIKMPIPDTYITSFTEQLRNEMLDSFILLWFTLTTNGIDLTLFYVYTNEYYSTIQEKQLFKGVGIKLLCACLSLFISFQWIRAQSTISVFAVSERCLKKYSIVELQHIIGTIGQYPDIVNEYDNGFPISSLYKIVCKIENKKLVKYYKSLGFEIDEMGDENGTSLSTTVGNILTNCVNKKIY